MAFGERGFGNRGGSGGGFNRGPRQMFPATCSKCGSQCEVPFEPREGRPVYCQNCFREMRGR